MCPAILNIMAGFEPMTMKIANKYLHHIINRANLCMIWKDFYIDKEMIFLKTNFDFDCIRFEQISENKQ